MLEEAKWQAVVLINKGGGYYHGIRLVEVVWKVVTVILNLLFKASIAFHNFLHGFRAGRGICTTYFEAKLLH